MAISQREARRLRQRVEELERQIDARNNEWARDYVGGVHIATINCDNMPGERSAVWTARRLRHAVVVTVDGNHLKLHALPEATR